MGREGTNNELRHGCIIDRPVCGVNGTGSGFEWEAPKTEHVL